MYFGSVGSCPEVKDSLLWWVPSNADQNGRPDFENYSKIGGWDNPYMKLFKVIQICNEQMY